MRTIIGYDGKVYELSEDVYIIATHNESRSWRYKRGTLVRLISGINDSDVPGYHFAPGWSTVCRIGAKEAEFVGFNTENDLLLVNNYGNL